MKILSATRAAGAVAFMGLIGAVGSADAWTFQKGIACVSKSPDGSGMLYYSNGAIANHTNYTNTVVVMCPIPLPEVWELGDELSVRVTGDEGSSGDNIDCSLRVVNEWGSTLDSVSGTMTYVSSESAFSASFHLEELQNYADLDAGAGVLTCDLPPEPSGSAERPRIFEFAYSHVDG